ncbi:hypothetical protein ACFYYP_04730 [Microbispora rosea]|uniref:hypothetical protein n=1 Tax=Microbispora rosea TaxID=58117 RepID=UPI0009705A04|nr:hypothetical protein Mro03_06850 [Microbispora rosea subsp. rosea]
MPGTSHGSLSPDAILTDLRELVECEPPSSDRCGAHAGHEHVVAGRLLVRTMPVREPAAEPLEGEA